MRKRNITYLLFLTLPLLLGASDNSNTTPVNDFYLINEVSYTSGQSVSLNFLEVKNINEQATYQEKFVVATTKDEEERVFNYLEEYTFVDRGLVLFAFEGYEDDVPLPDVILPSLTFNESLLIEIGHQEGFFFMVTDTLTLTVNESDNTLQVRPDQTESYHREIDIVTNELLDTGILNDDFKRGTPSPRNSAYGVRDFMMAETYDGMSLVYYYPTKNMLMSLTAPQLNYFRYNGPLSDFEETRRRYLNWAANVGDHDPYNEGLKPRSQIEPETLFIIVGLGILTLATGAFFFMKKKGH